MQKVFETYATRKNVVLRALRFMMDGDSIDPNATPTTLELKNMVQIDCLLEQIGGCSRKRGFVFGTRAKSLIDNSSHSLLSKISSKM